jgi:Recombination directionality factor-like
MPVVDIQRRGQQIGRLRLGQQVAVLRDGKDTGKTRPVKLTTFRFTTGSRVTARAIAELYGGEVRDWSGEYEVITSKSEIGVTVPPRDEVVSQWYEKWTKGGCERRCDSQREQITGGPCLCPHAEDPSDADEVARTALERSDLAKKNPPQACKLVTRISVMIPDLPGLGVFRLDTGSFYAAVEIGDSAALMQVARERGVFLPAILRIEQRQRVAGGQTKKYPVPVLEVLATFRDLATGVIENAGIAAQLPPAPGEPPRAITAGPPPGPAKERDSGPLFARMTPAAKAQHLADKAKDATGRTEIEALAEIAKHERLAEDHVCIDREGDVWQELHAYLTGQWKALPAGGEAA